MKPVLKSLNFVLVAFLLLASSATSGKAATASAAVLPSSLVFRPTVGGLTAPVFVTNAGDGSNRLFIVQQTGQIRIFKSGSLLSTPFLDISGLPSFTGVNGEQGLLGLAFDPSYTTNGFFYVAFTAPASGDGSVLTLRRFTVSSNPDVANAASGSTILTVDHPTNSNHNGGMLAFGPDGYLYWSTGDGGSGGDPPNNAQRLDRLLGKILRLDVDPAAPSVVPSTNAFVETPVDDTSTLGEIWAYGLRNPWRFSFDRLTGDLYIGDVGQDTEEEVDFQPSGDPGGHNYGWHVREGNLCYPPSSGCSDPPNYVAPVATYDHGVGDSYGCSITGGYVYRGTAFPSLQGIYFYGDFCSGKVLGLVQDPPGTWTSHLMASTSFSISSFGQDEAGELYLADYGGGTIYQISSPRISGSAGVGGANLTSSGGSTTADGSGLYTLTVPNGWSGTVTPSKAGYSFVPVWRSYGPVSTDRVNQDFTAGPQLFDDVPVTGKEWMQPWIEQFYYSGITSGCGSGPLIYCPENQVTRAEMAVFLLRAKHGAGHTPPAASHQFLDVPVTGKEWMEPWIDEFYAESLTTGCGAGNYCPENNVTRAEMAVFVLRSTHAAGYQPPALSHYFGDMPVAGKEWMEPWVDEFYREAITTGCGSGNFCPENPVTRAEMAVFIGRAFHLMP